MSAIERPILGTVCFAAKPDATGGVFLPGILGQFGTSPEPSAAYARFGTDGRVRIPRGFGPAVWDFCGITGESGAGAAGTWAIRDVVSGFDPGWGLRFPGQGPRWFAGASLNFAENLLRHRGAPAAIVFREEAGARRELSRRISSPATSGAWLERCAQRASWLATVWPGSFRILPGKRHRDARRGFDWRRVVIVLAGFRRARGARPVRPDCAAGARGRRRLPVRGERHRLSRSTPGYREWITDARARDRRAAAAVRPVCSDAEPNSLR